MFDAEAIKESIIGQEPSIRPVIIEAFLAGVESVSHTYEYNQYEIELAFFKWWFATQ